MLIECDLDSEIDKQICPHKDIYLDKIYYIFIF